MCGFPYVDGNCGFGYFMSRNKKGGGLKDKFTKPKESREMKRPLVVFDETGNTGQNLVDPIQPVFVLASVHLDDEEIKELMQILRPKRGQEVHFKSFSKSDSGKTRILRFCQSDLISSDKIKLSVIHKDYMVITKMVDLLIENLCYETGFDLYKNGANIALSNTYYMCIPTFCGKENFQIFLERFVNMIRNKNVHSIKYFYKSVENLRKACKHKPFNKDIDLIMATRQIVHEVIARCGIVDLDPAIPTFIHDCAEWGEQLGCEFDVVHDQSKPIEHQQEILSYLMAKDETETMIGYDRRKMKYPLKVYSFKLFDSKIVPQIQIADLISGAFAYILKDSLGIKVNSNFSESLRKTKLSGLIYNPVWPSDKVKPEDLGTTGTDEIDPNLYVGDLIGRQRKKRRKNCKG